MERLYHETEWAEIHNRLVERGIRPTITIDLVNRCTNLLGFMAYATVGSGDTAIVISSGYVASSPEAAVFSLMVNVDKHFSLIAHKL